MLDQVCEARTVFRKFDHTIGYNSDPQTGLVLTASRRGNLHGHDGDGRSRLLHRTLRGLRARSQAPEGFLRCRSPIITSIVVPHSKSKSHIPNTASVSNTSTRLQDDVGNYVGLDIGQVETPRILVPAGWACGSRLCFWLRDLLWVGMSSAPGMRLRDRSATVLLCWVS